MNEKMEEMINVTADFMWFDALNYSTQIPMMLQANEQLDAIMYTPIPSASFTSFENQGQLMDISQYVDQYGPDIKKELGEAGLAGTTRGGKLLGVSAVMANTVPVVNFTDVASSAYYAEAVAWAVSNGITYGTSDTTFSPDDYCTRAQAVTFLHRAEGEPSASGGTFSDVSNGSYYADAVAWAVAKEITNGTSATTFSPDDTCIRGQIVTFLWRDMA